MDPVSGEHERPPMRYRRFGGGYRREDVEFALASVQLTLRQLENELDALREEAGALEEELRSTRAELDAYRGREGEISSTMATALRRAGEIEQSAEERARAIVASAEDAAARSRADAHKRIEETGNRFSELLRMKDNLLEQMRAIVTDFENTISQVERKELTVPQLPVETVLEEPAKAEPQVELEVVDEPALVSDPEPEPDSVPEAGPEAEALPEPPPAAALVGAPAAAEPDEHQVFETSVELDAGPFADFGSLSAFERSLAALPGVDDVYVRRLADDRAIIELTLAETAPLLPAMRESLPYEIVVRSASSTALVLDVAPPASEGRLASNG